MNDWNEITRISGGAELEIERVRIVPQDIVIEGKFRLPPLAQLSADDQFFVTAFLSTHGSIKQMEQMFGISYPTVKNRLKTISQQLDMVNVQVNTKQEILDQLSQGEISVDEAVKRLKP